MDRSRNLWLLGKKKIRRGNDFGAKILCTRPEFDRSNFERIGGKNPY